MLSRAAAAARLGECPGGTEQHLAPGQGGDGAVVGTGHWEGWTHRLLVFLQTDTVNTRDRWRARRARAHPALLHQSERPRRTWQATSSTSTQPTMLRLQKRDEIPEVLSAAAWSGRTRSCSLCIYISSSGGPGSPSASSALYIYPRDKEPQRRDTRSGGPAGKHTGEGLSLEATTPQENLPTGTS